MRLILFIFFLIISENLFSQNSIFNDLGQNRIQFQTFDWELISSKNFEIYYNSERRNTGELTSKHLEEKFSEFTSSIGHQPYQKIKVFVYNSESELEQSNLGIHITDKFLTSNQNLNSRSILKISYSDNIIQFKKNLDYEYCKVLIEDLMNGNMTFAKRFGKLSFVNVPTWFSDGAAKFLAYGWDSEMDNVIRDYFLTQSKKSLNFISEKNSSYIGQSIWNYISIHYGEKTISNIINLTKIIRNAEKAISSSLGISFTKLINDWSKFYSDNTLENFGRDEFSKSLVDTGKYNKIIDVKTSPDNKYILFSSVRNGFKNLILFQKETEKLKVIDKIKNDKLNDSFYFEWNDNENISFLKSIRGTNFLITQNIISNKKKYKTLEKFDKIYGFSFNSTNTLIALAGSINNQSDIYLLSANSDNMKKITDDSAHDIYPSFFRKSTSILFSSNRYDEILNQESKLSENFNIFLYNLDTTSFNLLKLTNDENNNYKARGLSNNDFIFLSDKNGIYDLYYSKVGQLPFLFFKNSTNISNFSYDDNSKKLIYSSLFEGNNLISEASDINITSEIINVDTKRKSFINSLEEKEKVEDELKSDNIKKNINFETTENFIFEGESKIKSSILKNIEMKNVAGKNTYSKYKSSFVRNNFNSFIKVDPQEGFGSQVETDFIELFEDHKLFASAFLPFSSLKSSDLFTEYSYLKKRIDFKVSLDRKILFTENSERFIYHKYIFNQLNLNLSYPISKLSRFEIVPFYSIYKFSDLDYRIFNSTPPTFKYFEKNKFYGYFLNFKFDNTKKILPNIEIGSRFRINFKNYISKEINFKNFSFDISHHQKIYDDIVLSSRIQYGNSFGENPYKYLLGGVKNSLINNFDDKGINDPLIIANGFNNYNYIFSEYINLRGFDFNKFDGYKILVLNSELRVPIIKTLFGTSVSSSFLNSLQVAGFFDVGSSWNINSPFSKKSDVNTWIIKEPGSVFQAEIENSKNPWLASYGLSFRSFITDYYIKIDLAKPIEDYQIKNTKYHISFGYSF